MTEDEQNACHARTNCCTAARGDEGDEGDEGDAGDAGDAG